MGPKRKGGLGRCTSAGWSRGESIRGRRGDRADFVVTILGGLLRSLLSRLDFGRVGKSLWFILDSNRLGGNLGFLDGDANLKLGLCLGGAVKLLIDGDISRFEQDVGTSRVRIALECGFGIRRNVEK